MTSSTPQQAYDLCHEQGLTFKQISEELGITTNMARRYVKQCERKAWLEAQWHYGLPVQAANALLAAGFDDREQVLKAYHNGELNPKGTLSPHGLGKNGIQAVEEWLEIPQKNRYDLGPKYVQLAVRLYPDAQRALKRLEDETGELPSAIVARLILEADQSD
ncbi:sigma-70 family RNA polymerase sigma factor [Halomonas korlensis]|uniref:Uncharacterized protein n=1 Tax=Halomonas korlensis TaxID=463301 RepID=A0A1I7J3W6_9GAMM|nr:sigma-70 family RNA polymerase sigma factor [Halomonas korlensis]SFU79863.1 hypothetical protein SAMN04487955_10943 [Halomonas korlensis]